MSYILARLVPALFNFNSFLFNWTVFGKKRKEKNINVYKLSINIVENCWRRYDEQDELRLKTLLDYLLYPREIMELYHHLTRILSLQYYEIFLKLLLIYEDGFIKKKKKKRIELDYPFLTFLQNCRSILFIFNIPGYNIQLN